MSPLGLETQHGKERSTMSEPMSPEQEALRKQVALQNLEIAKRHGDVEAALTLDRIARGEEEVQTEPTPPAPAPTAEPAAEPPPATGAAAGGALSGSG